MPAGLFYPNCRMRRGQNWRQFCLEKACFLLCSLQSPGHLGRGSVQAGPTRLSWSGVVVRNVSLQLANVGCLGEAKGAKESRGCRAKCGEGWWTLQRTRTRHFRKVDQKIVWILLAGFVECLLRHSIELLQQNKLQTAFK